MPDSLPPDVRRRLAMVLALLTSDQDGEALNAGRMTVKLLAKHGLRPEQLVELGGGSFNKVFEIDRLQAENRMLRTELERLRQPKPPPADDAITNAAAFAADLLERAIGLTDREISFLEDLVAKRWGRPTEKQAAWLRTIAGKIPKSNAGRSGTW